MASLALMGLITISCGKDNSSGTSTPPPASETNPVQATGLSLMNFADVQSLQSAKSFNEGLIVDTKVFHVGKDYTQGGFSFNFSVCGNFWILSSCGDMEMKKMLTIGSLKKVSAVSSSSVSYKDAYDVKNGEYLFSGQTTTMNKEDIFYKRVLGTAYPGVLETKASKASVTLTDGRVFDDAILIEHFYGSESYTYRRVTGADRLVVVPSLPVFMNPVAIIEDINGYGNIAPARSNLGYIQEPGKSAVFVKSITLSGIHYLEQYGYNYNSEGVAGKIPFKVKDNVKVDFIELYQNKTRI